MKVRHISAVVLLTIFVMSIRGATVSGAAGTHKSNSQQDGPGNLYALSAVLMDGDSGRVLYEKDGDVPRPMASTTKVMTCILALENTSGDDYVQVSEMAAAQPEVKLGLRVGEQYYMEDLLYSLMLKSHNDTAVAIAEHVGGSVEGFAEMMNLKAKEIGCKDTYFITPNGLDASKGDKIHHTTAEDLARIMRYAIQNKTFLKITETRSYSFSDLSKSRHFSVQNANAFLDMTEGVLSGKTGYTADAGYCYVCACKKGDKTFIISLLGCGWPNNKTYKWTDSMKLLEYGNDNFQYSTFWKEPTLTHVFVENGVESGSLGNEIYLCGTYHVSEEEKKRTVLLGKDEVVRYAVSMKESIKAPIEKGQKIGEIVFYLDETPLCSYPITAERDIEELTFQWCVEQIFHGYFH